MNRNVMPFRDIIVGRTEEHCRGMIVVNGGGYYPDSLTLDNEFLGILAEDDVVGFVPNATERSIPAYFDFFRLVMANYGIRNVVNIDLSGPWTREAEKSRVIYLAGGNTFKLIKEIRECGFDSYIEHVEPQKIVVGNSAGAVVLGENILTTNDTKTYGIVDFHGMNLIPYSICPHYTPAKYQRLKLLSESQCIDILGVPEKCGIVFSDTEKRIGNIKEFRRDGA